MTKQNSKYERAEVTIGQANLKRIRRCYTSRSGITLILILLLLAAVSVTLARQALSGSTQRIAALAHGFSVESQWVAEGVARQWLTRGQDPAVSMIDLMTASQWQLGDLAVEVKTSSSEQKLAVHKVKTADWLGLWRRTSSLTLVDNPEQALLEASYTAIECLLPKQHISAQEAYLPSGEGIAPADLLTVWGEGRIDLNSASREILSAALAGFTDAQIGGILRLRQEAPIESLSLLPQELSLSQQQQEKINQMATLAPRHLELLITVRRGKLTALYHAVIDLAAPGRMLEVRLIF